MVACCTKGQQRRITRCTRIAASRRRFDAPDFTDAGLAASARCPRRSVIADRLGTLSLAMKTIGLLRQQAPVLAERIETASKSELRKVAAAVAKAAVCRTGLSDPVISRALEKLTASSEADRNLQRQVQAVAEDLDERYFTLKEPLEEREDAGKTDPEVMLAFSRARAASSVAEALGQDIGDAAGSAGYEAFIATDDEKYLIEALEKALVR